LGLTALFLTFSLSAWLAFLLIGIPAILWDKLASQKPKIALVFIASGLFLIVMSLAFNFQFLAPPTSFSRRSQLAEMSLKMTADKPLTGVGLNNFTNVMDNYGQVQATTRFLQPVHNIFLLVLSESGFLGLIGFTYLLFKFRKVRPYGIGLAMILFLGLFDHYPLTLQTGMLLLFWLI
jgi:O-antigen ligase